jgi:DNA-binding winged helix-turn-helix (wHTH) protein
MASDVFPTMEPELGERSSVTSRPNPRYIHFGPFQVDLQREEVSKNGVRLKLQGKVYQVLLALLEKPGEVVTREELRVRLWPADTHVNYDANVNTSVNKLRQVLGDSSDTPLYIETIPRKGYCLVVSSQFSEIPLSAAAPAPPQPADAPTVSQAAPPSSAGMGQNFWITLGVIGLVLAGMLLGAGITSLWMNHFAPNIPWP